MATDKDLATAAGTEVVAGTGQHRHEKADEGWIYTCSGATLNRLCESMVWGMASVLTAKSRPTLCPSHLPFSHTAYTAPCHLFQCRRNVAALLRIGYLENIKKDGIWLNTDSRHLTALLLRHIQGVPHGPYAVIAERGALVMDSTARKVIARAGMLANDRGMPAHTAALSRARAQVRVTSFPWSVGGPQAAT